MTNFYGKSCKWRFLREISWIFELFEVFELFEYLIEYYSIFDLQLFVFESETLTQTFSSRVKGPRSLCWILKLGKCFTNSLIDKKFNLPFILQSHLFRYPNSVVFSFTLSISFFRQKIKTFLYEAI